MRIQLAALVLALGACGDEETDRERSTATASPREVRTPAAGRDVAVESPSAVKEPMPATIGEARMEADGTIVLRLRATSSDSATGEALLRYPRDHAQYREVLDHLGGLSPGETKPVPPWPE